MLGLIANLGNAPAVATESVLSMKIAKTLC
jgi:hypothetical protein